MDSRSAAACQPHTQRIASVSAKLYIDTNKFDMAPTSLLVEAYHEAIQAMVRRRLAECGGDWASFVFDKSYNLVGSEQAADIERQVLATGHRFDWSAIISVQERPGAYRATPGMGAEANEFSFEHPMAVVAPADAAGREQRGIGDNVVRYPSNLVGFALYIRSTSRVMELLSGGVPRDSIAIIDDSGGTLTAPILEQFAGVICAGGTVRSHLGILTREYGIPCLMNARISGIKEGDRIELESSATARTAEDYQQGIETTARVWRLAR